MQLNTKDLSPEARAALADVLTKVTLAAREDPHPIEQIADLYQSDPQVRLLTESVISVLPAELDAGQWLAWLDGGPAPRASITLTDPDRGNKTSSRGAHHSAMARRDDAQRKVQDLEAKLKDAREDLKARTAELREASHQLRAVVAYRMIMEAAHLFSAPFSMGPMWTLVRAISGHLRTDLAYEASLDPEAATALAAHRVKRRESTPLILELLDFHCGDVALEMKLHGAVLATLEAHHKPVAEELASRNYVRKPLSESAKRLKRRSEERRASVRLGAPISDREEVLDGLRRQPSGASFDTLVQDS